ncbi:hypothetical protein LINPERPRIM_LOCUS12541 [Linum perenne]
MAPFNFKSYNHFITSSNGTTLQVYELTKPMVHPFSIRKTDWKEVANINISLEDDDDVDDDEAERMSYDGLLFFDGHGGIEGSKALTMLAQHLKRLRLLVNPEGYCFQESGELADYADFGIHYLRLNDLFSWPHHGVELAMITVWSRLEMKYHVSTSKRTKNDGVNLQKKLEELKKLLKERDEELEKLNEELEEAKEAKNEEMEQLRNKLKRKDEELRMLRKKKDKDHEANVKRIEELVKLKDEMEDANEMKDEELRMLRKKKDKDHEANVKRIEELMKLKDEMKDAKKQRKEEMQKANEELQKLRKEKDEELQKMIRDKDDQLQKLVKKKDDEKKDEIARVKKEVEQYSKLGKKKDDEKKDEIARVMKEVEQCSKSSCSWTMSPSVRYLPMDSEGTRVHLTRRRPVPPETFIYGEDPHDFVSCNMPRIEACLNVFNSAQFVDEQNTGWPIPSSFKVLIGKNNRGFDKHNWWFAKANHPEGGLTMLAYYDGNYSKFSSGPDRTIQLPFLKDATLAPFKPFFLLKVHSFGVKLVFMYRV